MGRTIKTLAEILLPDRLKHNSRMFIDVGENVHIHHREWRQVFSVKEFFEFCDVLRTASKQVREYLRENPDYREEVVFDTLFVAGGEGQMKKPLTRSPRPNQSRYFPHRFRIELLADGQIDEVHVHWRDHRFAIPRDHLRDIAVAFQAAVLELDEWEAAVQPPSRMVPTHRIRHGLPEPIQNGWSAGDEGHISELVERFKAGRSCLPLILSTEPDGEHRVISGHHRLCAAIRAGIPELPCVVTSLTFARSESIRKAEVALKLFDRTTGYRWGLAPRYQKWLTERFAQ